MYKVVSEAALSNMGAMHISAEQDLRMLFLEDKDTDVCGPAEAVFQANIQE